MSDRFPARLYRTPSGNWRLLITLPGVPADRWPTEEFTGGTIPTVYARAAALADLGYEVDGSGGLATPDGWSWAEGTAADGAVTLAANNTVRRRNGDRR